MYVFRRILTIKTFWLLGPHVSAQVIRRDPRFLTASKRLLTLQTNAWFPLFFSVTDVVTIYKDSYGHEPIPVAVRSQA